MRRNRKSSCPNIEQPRRTSTTPNRSSMKLDLYIEEDELQTTPARRNSPSPTSYDHHHHHHHHQQQQQNNRRRSSSSTNNVEETAEEVLCFRLLSLRSRYRFGGLRVNLISPVFNVNKLFNVEFDQDSQIALIKSQQSSFDDHLYQQQQNDSPSDVPLYQMNDFFHSHTKHYMSPPRESGGAASGRCATIVIEPESEDQKDEITRQLPLLTADLTLIEETNDNKNDSNNKNNDDKNEHHSSAAARSLTCIPEPETILRYAKRHQSTSSINNNNEMKFDNVKVYTKVECSSSSDVKQSIKNLLYSPHHHHQQSSSHSLSPTSSKKKINNSKKEKTTTKIKDMRRHTHFYCHIPTSLTSGSSSSTSKSSN